ncbi:hypothetical protein D9M70_588220 [compost metagenome]
MKHHGQWPHGLAFTQLGVHRLPPDAAQGLIPLVRDARILRKVRVPDSDRGHLTKQHGGPAQERVRVPEGPHPVRGHRRRECAMPRDAPVYRGVEDL